MYSYYMQPFLKRAFFTTCLDCYVCFFAIFLNVNMNLSIWAKEYVTTDMLLKSNCHFGRLSMACQEKLFFRLVRSQLPFFLKFFLLNCSHEKTSLFFANSSILKWFLKGFWICPCLRTINCDSKLTISSCSEWILKKTRQRDMLSQHE